ncbi:Hypothetical predicted protein [Pelobates cultripes]|uniref:Uncharacterized protein n=1 Tax=Pelobates cultripes TaxID=61616 RepID=A0AAD1W262_PELCU|nr:Hypothetical predicted protein [Pelobates cultripes]
MRQIWKSDLRELRQEMGAIQNKLQVVEEKGNAREARLQAIEHTPDGLTQHVQRLHRSVAIQEARHRRHNICLRGIPEAIKGDALLPYILKLLTSIGLQG